jgi:ribosomal protein S21
MKYQKNNQFDVPYDMRLSGTSVFVKDGNVETALRKLKKKVQESGKLQQVQDKTEYIKPTTLRKRKAAQARKRWLKQLALEKLPEKKY